jgi:nicotinamide-nucleotide amidase
VDAVILAVGSELLGTDRLDTNSLLLTASLERHGWRVAWKAAVPDDREAIVSGLERAAADARVVLVSGGLGPTEDDLTREAVARFAVRELRLDPTVLAGIEARYRSFGHRMPSTNRRQAEVIDGARVLPNPAGTAPGLHLSVERGACAAVEVFLFPGVPRELQALVETELEPWLAAHPASTAPREQVELRVAGLPESLVEERIRAVYEVLGRERVAVLASPGDVRIRLRPPADDGGAQALAQALAAVREGLGDALVSERGEDLEVVVLALLAARGATLSVAESCTGGLVGERLTAVPGSSASFAGGAIVYSNELKRSLLGVSAEDLERHGAVSTPVARAMAEGALDRFGTDYALAITGVAGPDGGSDEKPVGTVHLGLAGGGVTRVLRVRLPGDRERIRRQASQLALEMLRRRLLGLPIESYWEAAAAGPAAASGAQREVS